MVSESRFRMSVLKPRSRMISVRLSEEEYAALSHLCLLTGARSVSDLTRGALQALLKGGQGENTVGVRINNFRAQISSLSAQIEQLAVDLTSFPSDDRQ